MVQAKGSGIKAKAVLPRERGWDHQMQLQKRLQRGPHGAQGEWRKGDGVSGGRAGQKLLDARLHTFSLGPVDPSLELGGVDPRCVEECGGTATAEGLPVGIPRGEGGEGGTSKGKSEEGPTLPGGRTWDACSGCWSAGKAETQAVPVDVSGGDQDSF